MVCEHCGSDITYDKFAAEYYHNDTETTACDSGKTVASPHYP